MAPPRLRPAASAALSLLLATCALAGEPPTAPRPAGPTLHQADAAQPFHLELQAVRSHGMRTLQRHDGGRGEPSGQMSVSPWIVLYPRGPAPVASPSLILRCTRMVGPNGEELIDTPRAASRTVQSFPEPPRYLFPATPSTNFGATYTMLSTASLAIPVPGRPRYLRLLEGEIESEIVTEDLTRDLVLTGDRLTAELLPGFEFTIERDPDDPGRGIATCAIDPAQCPPGPNGEPPCLNLVQFRVDSIPKRLHLSPKKGEDGIYRDSTAFSMPRAGKPLLVFVHIVLATRTVRSPFRLEHIDLMGSPPSPSAGAITPPAHRAAPLPHTAGDFAVSLSHFRWSGYHTVPPVHPTVRMATLAFEAAGPPEGTVAAVTAFRLFELTDEEGRPFPIMPPFTLDNPAGVSKTTRFQWSKEAEGSHQWPDYDSNVGVAEVRLPLAWLPDRIGRVRGEFTIREGGRGMNFDIPLDRHDTVTEIVPGVHVAVRKPGSDPDRMPPGWVTLLMETPSPESAAAAPKLDSIKFIDADGTINLILTGAEQRKTPRGTVMYLGFEAGYTRAAKLQIRMILDNRERTIPFELTDLPFAD